MIQAGDIFAMQRARRVLFHHGGRTYEGVVQWIKANDSALSHERNHQDCVSLMLSDGSTMNNLPKAHRWRYRRSQRLR